MNENTQIRSATDILLSVEEKMTQLTKMLVANDLNNKLILERLNKLLGGDGLVAHSSSSTREDVRVSSLPSVDMQTGPVKTKRNPATKKVTQSSVESKIAVGQRVTDTNGKDIFNADIVITNLTDGVVTKVKTNAVGKWQTHLPVGRYSVQLSKIVDPDSLRKIEHFQEIEISEQTKALQLPVLSIQR